MDFIHGSDGERWNAFVESVRHSDKYLSAHHPISIIRKDICDMCGESDSRLAIQTQVAGKWVYLCHHCKSVGEYIGKPNTYEQDIADAITAMQTPVPDESIIEEVTDTEKPPEILHIPLMVDFKKHDLPPREEIGSTSIGEDGGESAIDDIRHTQSVIDILTNPLLKAYVIVFDIGIEGGGQRTGKLDYRYDGGTIQALGLLEYGKREIYRDAFEQESEDD